MAVTYGFYNALNHDRLYDAIQMSSIFDGIIQDGIFSTIGTSMIVTAPEDGMFVDVGPGRAWFNHTWTLNDTELPVEAEAAEVVLDRIDAVILEVNAAAEVRANSIKFLKGTPSSNPVKPTLTHNAEVNQYALAYVTIRAGQTTIFQSDIENVVGTDETPFVTGLLQQLSIERLLLQWDDEFHRYFANFKTVSEADLNTWFNARKNEYDAWYADMELEGAADLATFDAWFQHMKDQLDEDAAGHLQAEIDDLAEQCEKGSIVTVTTEESSLIGRSCTISQGPNSVVKTFDSNGVAYFPSIPYVGNNIDVRATNGDNIAQGTLTIPYFGRYDIEIDFWAATLDIHSTVEALYGRTLTISKGGSTVGTTTFDNTGHATFKVHETGTYHISTSTAGGDVYETDVTVTEETVYPISLGLPNGQTVTPVNDIQTWLKCAGITDKAYLTTLADVLNEPATYETLLSDSNACDYLARSTAFAGNKDGLVPKMTDATHPSGEAYASAEDYMPAWKAFDRTDASVEDGWATTIVSGSDNYVAYDFGEPVIVDKVYLKNRNHTSDNNCRIHTFKVQGSNTKTSGWVDVSDVIDRGSAASASDYGSTHEFNNNVAYRYYRILVLSDFSSSNITGVAILQFYRKGITDDATAMATLGKYDYACEVLLGNATWAEAIAGSEYYESVLDVKVPTMTSNTTPEGEASGDSVQSSTYPAWKAFDKNASTCWHPTASAINHWLKYDFGFKMIAKKMDIHFNDPFVPYSNSDLILSGSNDNSNWTELWRKTIGSTDLNVSAILTSNNTAYRYYKWDMGYFPSPSASYSVQVNEANLYGRHEAQTGSIIHSAPVDTIYYISAGQQVPVCVTDADGIGHFDLDDLPKGSLTLYSTVAKDPDNLSNSYSKQFTITSNTTELWLMPDGALYWWGWINGIEDCTSANGWAPPSSSYTLVTPTHNTNSIRLSAPGDLSKYVAIAISQKQVANKAIVFVYNGVTSRSDGTYLVAAEYATKTMTSAINVETYKNGGMNKKQHTAAGSNYFTLNGSGSTSDIYAILI